MPCASWMKGIWRRAITANRKPKIKLEVDRKETFTYDNYSWTEHISRKSGQWLSDPKELLDQMEKCGFVIRTKE